MGTRLAFPTSPRAVRIPAGTAKALGEADVASSERARVVADERAVATGERGTGGGGWHRRSGPHAWHATFHGRSMRRRSTLDQPER